MRNQTAKKGMIKSGESFELTDGQTLIVQGLPTNLQYKVTQDDYTQDGYVTDPESLIHMGTIPEKNYLKHILPIPDRIWKACCVTIKQEKSFRMHRLR